MIISRTAIPAKGKNPIAGRNPEQPGSHSAAGAYPQLTEGQPIWPSLSKVLHVTNSPPEKEASNMRTFGGAMLTASISC